MGWKEVRSNHTVGLYETICNVLKHDKAQHPSNDISFTTKNSKFKLEFDWHDESTCGITILKHVADQPEPEVKKEDEPCLEIDQKTL